MDNQLDGAEYTIPMPTLGAILEDEFLRPFGITPHRLSKELHVSAGAVMDLIHGKCKLTPPMALRLAKFFGNSERFWINLQANIEIQTHKPEMEAELAKIKPVN